MTVRGVAVVVLVSALSSGCGGAGGTTPAGRTAVAAASGAASGTVALSRPGAARDQKPRPLVPGHPRVLAAALGPVGDASVPVVVWRGRPVAWLARTASGVTLLTLDQKRLELRLHSGTTDAGATGWRFGASVRAAERGRLVAAFNGGFRLSVGAGGFMSYGRVAVGLRDGLGSIVTYADATTDVGAWHQEVPAPGRTAVSVRQNLPLLIDHGRAASNVGCRSCWGATLGGVDDPARSALGVTAAGQLVWAGGEHLTVSQLASALVAVGVVRGVELDINPEWVAGYLFGHPTGRGRLSVVPIVPGQNGIPGQFLAPWSRDFFTVVAR
jgi:hypothetical protein